MEVTESSVSRASRPFLQGLGIQNWITGIGVEWMNACVGPEQDKRFLKYLEEGADWAATEVT